MSQISQKDFYYYDLFDFGWMNAGAMERRARANLQSVRKKAD